MTGSRGALALVLHTHMPYVCRVADPKGKKRLVTSAASFGQVLTEMHLKINRRTGEVARGKSFARNILVTRDVNKVRAQSNLLAFWKSLSDVQGDEVVLLNLRDGVYYGLDGVGARVWTLVQEPRTVAARLRFGCL